MNVAIVTVTKVTMVTVTMVTVTVKTEVIVFFSWLQFSMVTVLFHGSSKIVNKN